MESRCIVCRGHSSEKETSLRAAGHGWASTGRELRGYVFTLAGAGIGTAGLYCAPVNFNRTDASNLSQMKVLEARVGSEAHV